MATTSSSAPRVRSAMLASSLTVRQLLMADGPFAPGTQRVPWRKLLLVVLVVTAFHGAAIGSLGVRPRAMLYGAIKLPILFSCATLLCLPNLYVVHACCGLRKDFDASVRGILCAQGTAAVTLVALAPVVLFAYACDASYPAALLVNATAFALAAWAAQVALSRHLAPLIARDGRHRRIVVAWFVLHAFVATKVSWILRPFVGDPELPVAFLRAGQWWEDPFTNLFWAAAALLAGLFR